MGLGLSRPELLLLPLTLILIWVLIDLGAIFLGMRLYDRSAQRRKLGPGVRGGKQRAASAADEDTTPQVLRICQWCNGTGRLLPDYVQVLDLEPLPEGEQYQCPECGGAGHFDASSERQNWDAYRKKLVKQEWKE